jgi:hypothetical protein
MFTVELAAIRLPSVFSAGVELAVWVKLSRAGTERRRLVTVTPHNAIRPDRVYIVDLRCWEGHEIGESGESLEVAFL